MDLLKQHRVTDTPPPQPLSSSVSLAAVESKLELFHHFVSVSDFRQAEFYIRSSVEAAEAYYGENSPDLIPVLTEAATFYCSREKYFEAKTMFSAAAAICETRSRHDHHELAKVVSATEPTREMSKILARGIASLSGRRSKQSAEVEVQVDDVTCMTNALCSHHDVRALLNAAPPKMESNYPPSDALLRLRKTLSEIRKQ